MGKYFYITTWLLLVMVTVLEAADNEAKILYDFENATDLNEIKAASEGGIFDVVQDNGVTRGTNCLRMVATMGADYAVLGINSRDKLAEFAKYDYFGIDVFNGMQEDIDLMLEFSDVNSKNYPLRCSYLANKVHPGRNHLIYRIDQLKRNNKEGRSWDELEPQDKIRKDSLTVIKLMFTPPKQGGDTKLWIDSLSLLPESAANPTVKLTLPKSAIGFKFGNKAYCPSGFTVVGAKDMTGAGVQEIGAGWPDNLTGNGVTAPGEFSYTINAPAGKYLVWLSAGKLYEGNRFQSPYVLRLDNKVLLEEKLSEREFYGEKGIFRFMRTQYSERPNALWLDYVEPEAQEFTGELTIGASAPQLTVSNMRLSALILVPAGDAAGFTDLCSNIRKERMALFSANTYVKPQVKPTKKSSDGAFTMWFPPSQDAIRPWSDPSTQKGDGKECQWSATPGERVIQQICVTPWQDLGMGDITVSDLKGPGTIAATNVRKYYMNYRFQEGSVGEMSLLPWTKIRFEPGITWAYWMWLQVPADALPGTYTGSITFASDKGGKKQIPLKLTVQSFTLISSLPASLGMYYGPWQFTPASIPEGFASVADFKLNQLKEQFAFMRDVGFTAVPLPMPAYVNGALRSDDVMPYWQAAKAAGFGANPAQKCMVSQLGIARGIARAVIGPKVDQNPGSELHIAGFEESYKTAMRQYKKWLDEMKMPVAMEVVDEPREVPNPWNRNLDDTIRYATWLKELGFDTFVSFMADGNSGKDYTTLTDSIGIVSIHAWELCAKLMAKARQTKKEVWLYNVGMDRLSWGFFNWANESKGRWEWHFCFYEEGSAVGHPNPNEWYTPFTTLAGYANHAPYCDSKGGMTFRTDFLNAAQGITDYAYICTLEQAITANVSKPAKAGVVKQAQDFLASVRKTIPPFIATRGMVSPDQGALVGKGLDTPLAAMSESWREKIALLLKEFAKP